MLYAVVATALGMCLVGWIQYADTGEWFRFFSIQSEWDNRLRIPTLPLRSWGGDFPTRMDALSLFAAVVCGAALFPMIFSKKQAVQPASPMVLSMAYCAGMGLLVLAFRGGSLFSLNRFVLATPFIMVLIHAWVNSALALKRHHLWGLAGGSLLFWLLFASWTHISNFLAYGFISVCVMLFVWIKLPKTQAKQLAIAALVLIQCYFQYLLFARFLDNGWIG